MLAVDGPLQQHSALCVAVCPACGQLSGAAGVLYAAGSGSGAVHVLCGGRAAAPFSEFYVNTAAD